MDIRSSYDSAARAYADQLADELEQKPLDRHILNRFAEAVQGRGLVADLGCGPGHVGAYLRQRGVDVVGFDLSPGMIREAARLHPAMEFRVADFAALDLPAASLAGVVAFYSIVHLAPSALESVLAEWRRVIAPGGMLLVAFHVGDETVHVDDLWGAPVSLDFRFHDPGEVADALGATGFATLEKVQREPYEGVEYVSRRCYLLARAVESDRKRILDRQ